MSFHLVILGCGGGPDERNLSSYLFKTQQSRWMDGILAVEAGSGLGALTELLVRDPSIFKEDSLDPFVKGESLEDNDAPSLRAGRIYSWIRTFLVSHAHLDHVNGLILGAGATASPVPRHIAALESVIRDLESVFDGQKLWPRLARRKEELVLSHGYVYDSMEAFGPYRGVAPNLSARLFPISHGLVGQVVYESTAFFVRNETTFQEFLFFGDVEPDSISANPQTHAVWRSAAPLILAARLTHVFLECSWRKSRPPAELYGHLSPPHVVDEMKALAREVAIARQGSLSINAGLAEDCDLVGVLVGVTLVVIHCKEPMEHLEPSSNIIDVIVGEIRELLRVECLGVNVIAAHQGMRLQF
ncbi:hypothetical protein BS47DRAFT_1322241 [Hydnum rufescens UP504]|uniref:Cyclic-AMP phosphodiesterase n=1 Tax=Hydnum rufescens UP504 TaxID=1448309 RepID=A0A9P6AI14_9AGAM|nr:hypothetical protein BS47DRAFT_1322241 [Hydnum rufescens UP504]